MKLSNLGNNVVWLATATGTTMLASLFYGLLVARSLGPASFGKFALVVGVGSWLVSLSQGAGSTALMVLSAQHVESGGLLFWPGVIIQGAVGCASVVVSLVAVWLLSADPYLLLPTTIYSCSTIASLIAGVPISIYRGLNDMKWGFASAAAGLLTVILMVGVRSAHWGVAAAITANAIAQISVMAALLPMAFKKLRVTSLTWNNKFIPQLWSASVALWAVTIAQASHWRVGLIMTQLVAGTSAVGMYTAASKLLENLRLIPWLLLMAILPGFVQAKNDGEKFRAMISEALRYVLLIVFPLYALLVILAPLIIALLYGREFTPATSVLLLGAFGLIPMFVHWVFLTALLALRKEKELVITYVVSITAEVCLDWILVRTWQANGAAVGYIVGEAAAAILSGWYISRYVSLPSRDLLWRTMAPGAMAIALSWLIPQGIARTSWAMVVLILYALTVVLSGAFKVADLLKLLRGESVYG